MGKVKSGFQMLNCKYSIPFVLFLVFSLTLMDGINFDI